MSKSLWLNIFRLIKSTKGRFISLTSIVAIGVAFFVGVSASSPIMGQSVDYYNDETHLKDFTIYSNYGFDEDDINNLKSIDGIDYVEGTWFADVLATYENETSVTRIHAYDDNYVNDFVLVEGRLPKNEHEALSEKGSDLIQGFPLNAKVSFSYPNNTKNESLLIDEVTVVGTIDTPLYLNETKENSTLSNQHLNTYLYVPSGAFDNEFYLEVNLISNKAQEMYSFSDEYEDYTDKLKEDIEEYAKAHENDRVNKIRDEALDEYEKGYKEYLEAKKEFDEKIDEATEDIEDGEKELSEGEKELLKAEKELQDSQNSLNEEERKALEEINNGKAELEKAKETLNTEKQNFEYTKSDLLNKKGELQNNLNTINDAENKLNGVISVIQKHINNKVIHNNTNVQSFFYDVEVIKRAASDFNIPTTSKVDDLNNTLFSTLPALKELQGVVSSFNQSEKISDSLELQMIKANYPELDGMISTNLNNDSTISDYVNSLNNLIQGINTYSASSSKYNGYKIDDLTSSSSELQSTLSMLGTGSNDSNMTFGSILTNLNNQLTELNNNLNSINDGIKEINNGISEGESKLSAAEEEIKANEEKLNNALLELNKKIKEAQLMIDNGAGTIAQNRYDLFDAANKLSQAKKDLEEAHETGEKELKNAKEELDDAKKKIDEIEDNEWTVLNRKEHYASATYANTVDQMKAIGNIFPVFFILVAALVCLTTMTRMVDEERSQIGVLRALGYTELQCASKYLIYALLATLLGSVIGVVVGIFSFPIIIYDTWRMMYILPDVKLFIPYKLIAISVLSFVVGMLLTTWYACRSDMKEVPAQLMRPKAPKLGKSIFLERIKLVWNHLSFTWKVTFRNIFRYRRRFIMTVLGVAGCTALLVTGFGIRDSINSMVGVQFYDIYKYDGSVKFEKSLAENKIENFVNELEDREEFQNVTICGAYSALVKNDNGIDETVTVEIFKSDEDISKTYSLRERIGKKEIHLDDEGLVISEKLSENLGVKVGDTILLEAENGVKKDIPVSAICEMYIRHYAFISEACYREYFNSEWRSKSILVDVKDNIDSNGLQSYIVEDERVDSIEFFDVILSNFDNMVKGLTLIVWTLIISSMSLAFVVLGNLINVNISERQREIATIKVLGFRRKEVSDYIYKENNVLVFLGALVGLPVGNILHHYIMRMVEMDYIMFGRSITPLSFIISVILTIFFGLLVNILMAKKIRDVQMVESLKSVE